MSPRGITALMLAAAVAAACNDTDRDSRESARPAPSAPSTQASAPATASGGVPQASASAPPASTAAPEPAPGPAPEFVIVAGGDVNLGRETGQTILKDPNYNPLLQLTPIFKGADYRFVNLESQLSDQGGETQSKLNRLIFTGPPGGGRMLANASIDVVSIANNHAWDYGKSAFLETLRHLEEAGVGFAGASAAPNQQYKPHIFRAKGWSVATFAVTHIWNQGEISKHPGQAHVAWARYDLLHNAIKRAKREHDLVLVSYHGGGEYIDVPLVMTREFVRAVMNAGVDVLIGHHPHVVHGVSWYDTRPAFYSLGNLVFNMHKDYEWTGTGFLARLSFRRDAPPKVHACPYHILGHTPTLYDGPGKAQLERAFAQRLKQVSLTVGGTSVGEPAEYSCMELTPPEKKEPAKPKQRRR
ncbi:MAG TPA: CapA family protein [Polyangiaceae bacterium]